MAIMYWSLAGGLQPGPGSTLTSDLIYFIHDRATPTPPRVASMDATRALGRDLKFNGDREVGPSGDYIMVQGDAAVRQAVYNCLITEPGQYKLRPNYGVGLLRFLGKVATPARKEEIKSAIKGGLLRLRRIEDVSEVVLDMPDAYTIRVQIAIRAAGRVIAFDQPFTLSPTA